MRRRTSTRFIRLSVASALLISLISATPSHALSQFNERPSTVWGHTYAGSNSTTSSKASPKSGHLDQKSKFVVTYKNFPEWAKKDVQTAVDVWSANFASSVPITIEASWGRSSSFGVLGSARPGNYFQSFAGAPDSTLWYPSALANALAGKDLDTKNAEIVIQVNSAAQWDTRNDGAPRSNEYDLESVIIHEMGHGLGFLSTDSYDTFYGYGSIDQPTPYDAYVQLPDGQRLSDLASPSIELGQALTGKLVWSGALGMAANGGVKPLLYSPTRYEDGSSVSHLDEATFGSSGPNAVMTPNLDSGEIFHEPGPLLLAMMEDMRRKPPAGVVVGVPQVVRNAHALVSDGSLIVSFDPPANVRVAQVTGYTIRNLKTDQVKTVTESPAIFTGLKNGTTYTFSITAANINGPSDLVTTTPVAPQAQWKRTVIDAASSAAHITSTTFNGAPTIAYTDSKKGLLKLAIWNGAAWKKVVVDGAGGNNGRTRTPITSPISLCVNGSGTKQTLHIFYSESEDRDLHYAAYDGKSFKYEIIDGNGSSVNDYKDLIRVRTASDVSISSACVADGDGVQVFYRDESQGILLGATKAKGESNWNYELVDGDRKTDGRTTGDTAFHLKAIQDGKKTYVLYDSVLTINQNKEATSGEIRVASRTGLAENTWKYQNLDSSGSSTPMTGFDVAIVKSTSGVLASWLVAAPSTMPNPNRIRWSEVKTFPSQSVATSEDFGAPDKYLSMNGNSIAFNCFGRLCVLDTQKSSNQISLVAKEVNPDGIESAWVVLNRIRYLVAGINGQLVSLRP